jgi:hypothetical protein
VCTYAVYRVIYLKRTGKKCELEKNGLRDRVASGRAAGWCKGFFYISHSQGQNKKGSRFDSIVMV